MPQKHNIESLMSSCFVNALLCEWFSWMLCFWWIKIFDKLLTKWTYDKVLKKWLTKCVIKKKNIVYGIFQSECCKLWLAKWIHSNYFRYCGFEGFKPPIHRFLGKSVCGQGKKMCCFALSDQPYSFIKFFKDYGRESTQLFRLSVFWEKWWKKHPNFALLGAFWQNTWKEYIFPTNRPNFPEILLEGNTKMFLFLA